MQGLHLTADLYECAGDASLLTDAHALADLCREKTLASGLTLVAEKWHTFPDYQGQPGGVTGMLLLAESHLAVHTWPERNAVTLDVYVCNFESDNSEKPLFLVNALEAAFKPAQTQHNRLWRGAADGPAPAHLSVINGHDDLLLEDINPSSFYGFRFSKRLLELQTDFQYLELYDSDDLGKTLRLDGCLMTSEKDEFFYHESLIHPAAMAHPKPKHALILGGGDGGALEELLKHPLESVTLVDLDQAVIDVSREHLQNIHRGAFDDPRAQIHVADGAKFIEETNQKFDLIYLDLTDPETPAGPLYTQAFFQACRRVLSPGGAIVLHLGAPFYEPDQIRHMSGTLKSVFQNVHAYGLHIPLYGAYWAMAVVSNELNPLAIDAQTVQARLDERQVSGLQYYNRDIHGALFALPTYYLQLVDNT